ncbi:MAG: sulfatase [Thermoanaerobaculia bacterium]
MRRAPWMPLAALLLGCAQAPPEESASAGRGFAATPTRGYILISIDTLRADHLGAWGYELPTSPFLDQLAARSTVFENAWSQVPSTLPSHISMFTGLYPAEHGVFPPSAVLSPEIHTLPELLRQAGFRTGGHTEGGYVQGGYGFARGFDEWTDTPYDGDADIVRTLGRGLEFARGVPAGERFFLFLHSYTVHDPYEPPEPYRSMFWSGPPPADAGSADGPHFAAVNSGAATASPEAIAYYRALYDGSIRYLDDALRSFFGELESSGLLAETTVILTSDHGEEFGEHGRLVHTQIYPECLHVPLLVVHPGQPTGSRSGALAESVDLLPTILDLAGAPAAPGISGSSLRGAIEHPDATPAGEAYAEVKIHNFQARTLIQAEHAQLWQAIHAEAVSEADGFWASKQSTFDAVPPAFEFGGVAFHTPREIAVTVDGRPRPPLRFETDWKSFRIELPPKPAKQRIRLTTPECESPLSLGLGNDGRCLSFKLHGATFERRELYELTADRRATDDRSTADPDRLRALLRRLRQGYSHQPRFIPESSALTDEQVRHLKALGYLQ